MSYARHVFAALPILLLLLAPAWCRGQCAPTVLGTDHTRAGDTIGIVAGTGLALSVVDEAVAVWRSCPNYGIGFPAFAHGRGHTRTVEVWRRRHSGSPVCGLFIAHRIDLFSFAINGRGAHRYCGPKALTLAHELGHVLGLGDSSGPGCRRHLMSNIYRINRQQRRVQDSECQLAGQLWLTLAEQRLVASSLLKPPG